MTKDPQAEAYYDYAAAQMLVHAGRFREAVPLLQDALKRDPDSAFLWMQLAQWLVRADQPADALVAARKAVQLAPEEIQPHLTLAELLRAGPVSPAEGAYIGVEICRALDYAHRKAGIVHRDVTPRNVMIDAEGMVKVIDFGIASPASATASGALFGSPGHMAPEQLRPGPVTPAADVFAVAVLLIETWTGKPPFRRESFAASADALREPPPPDWDGAAQDRRK